MYTNFVYKNHFIKVNEGKFEIVLEQIVKNITRYF